MKPIRSFVKREGRMSKRQQFALDTLWPRYGVELKPGNLESEQLFGRRAPMVVEVGFGMGKSLAQMAIAAPETNFLGIEVHTPGVGSLLADIGDADIDNIRIIQHDAVAVFKQYLGDDSIDKVQIFFPDPWPKQRHQKRRLLQAGFVDLLVQKLKPGGFIHCATDWQNYAEQMMDVLTAQPGLRNRAGLRGFSVRPESRPLTKFEQRGQRLGHGVWDLIFEVCQ